MSPWLRLLRILLPRFCTVTGIFRLQLPRLPDFVFPGIFPCQNLHGLHYDGRISEIFGGNFIDPKATLITLII